MSKLQESVRPEGHPDLKGALVIASTHHVVNKYNDICLEDLKTDLVEIEAINSHNNIPNFMPRIDQKKKTVKPTPYLQKLRIKEGCRVMLTVNLDVKDSLCNGSIGTLKRIVKNIDAEVKFLLVKFDNKDSGRELRRCHPQLARAYPGCTLIKREVHKYSTAEKSRGEKSNVATVQQFPLILSFASTTHKIQGQTIKAPTKVAVHLMSVWGPNQAYVMLGRVEERSQLFIIDKLAEGKIYNNKEAMNQLAIMKAKSLNNNPPVWEQSLNQSIKICFHNIHSLKDKIEDVQGDLVLHFADLIIFAETWLEETEDCSELQLQINGYKLHLNSWGRGKGLATYGHYIRTSTTHNACN